MKVDGDVASWLACAVRLLLKRVDYLEQALSSGSELSLPKASSARQVLCLDLLVPQVAAYPEASRGHVSRAVLRPVEDPAACDVGGGHVSRADEGPAACDSGGGHVFCDVEGPAACDFAGAVEGPCACDAGRGHEIRPVGGPDARDAGGGHVSRPVYGPGARDAGCGHASCPDEGPAAFDDGGGHVSCHDEGPVACDDGGSHVSENFAGTEYACAGNSEMIVISSGLEAMEHGLLPCDPCRDIREISNAFAFHDGPFDCLDVVGVGRSQSQVVPEDNCLQTAEKLVLDVELIDLRKPYRLLNQDFTVSEHVVATQGNPLHEDHFTLFLNDLAIAQCIESPEVPEDSKLSLFHCSPSHCQNRTVSFVEVASEPEVSPCSAIDFAFKLRSVAGLEGWSNWCEDMPWQDFRLLASILVIQSFPSTANLGSLANKLMQCHTEDWPADALFEYLCFGPEPQLVTAVPGLKERLRIYCDEWR